MRRKPIVTEKSGVTLLANGFHAPDQLRSATYSKVGVPKFMERRKRTSWSRSGRQPEPSHRVQRLNRPVVYRRKDCN